MAGHNRLLDRLAGVVGADNLSTDPGRLEGYREAGFASGTRPSAIASPSSAGQVRELVRLARSEDLNLVFSSSFPPRFRGDSVPEEDGIIVDMSGMDRIVRIDRRNKVALIEPGVTFTRLIEAADRDGLKVLLPLLPRAGKSVLASYLEREPILIPKYHWDMTDPLLCTELVFGTGDLFRTGSAAGPGGLKSQWESGGAQKNPLGPAQSDFLRVVQGAQGTMAGVTWGSVKLEVKPSIHRIRFLPGEGLSSLVEFSYQALRPKLGDEFLILNSRALSTVISGDGETKDGQAPYTLIYGVSGYEYLPRERVAYQEHDLAEIARACGMEAVTGVPGCSGERMEGILEGPSGEPYYKARPRGAFADIFFLTTMDRVASFVSKMESTAEEHGYPSSEIGVYIQPIQHGRAVHLEFTIYYDPDDQRDTGRARELFTVASKALRDAGGFFSRPYGIWSDMAYSGCPDTVEALRKVKKMLDPDRVLNRGKLCFSGEAD